jgi:hypothetical protein
MGVAVMESMDTGKMIQLITQKLFRPMRNPAHEICMRCFPGQRQATKKSKVPSVQEANRLVAEVYQQPFTYLIRARAVSMETPLIESISAAKALALFFMLEREGYTGLKFCLAHDEQGGVKFHRSWIEWQNLGHTYLLDPALCGEIREAIHGDPCQTTTLLRIDLETPRRRPANDPFLETDKLPPLVLAN